MKGLSTTLKRGTAIRIGDNIVVTIEDSNLSQVRLRIVAPPSLSIEHIVSEEDKTKEPPP